MLEVGAVCYRSTCVPKFHPQLYFLSLHWCLRWYHLVSNFNYHLCAEDTQVSISTQPFPLKVQPCYLHTLYDGLFIWMSQGHLKLSIPEVDLHFFHLNLALLPVSLHQWHHHLSSDRWIWGYLLLSLLLFLPLQLISSIDLTSEMSPIAILHFLFLFLLFLLNLSLFLT